MNLPIPNRRSAGRTLAAFLEAYREQRELVVLALSPDGVPVAYEISQGLDAPLDILLVQKLQITGSEQLDLSMVVGGDQYLLNDDIVLEPQSRRPKLDAAVQQQQRDASQRLRDLRGDRQKLPVKGHTVILVDDVLTQSQTARAAIKAMREEGAARVVVAVPILPNRVLTQLQTVADDVSFIATQEPFLGVDWWYEDHRPLATDEVRNLLRQGAAPPVVHASHPKAPIDFI